MLIFLNKVSVNFNKTMAQFKYSPPENVLLEKISKMQYTRFCYNLLLPKKAVRKKFSQDSGPSMQLLLDNLWSSCTVEHAVRPTSTELCLTNYDPVTLYQPSQKK